MNLAGKPIAFLENGSSPAGFRQTREVNGQAGLGRYGLGARNQGNHQYSLYAKSEQICALILRNYCLGIGDALNGNRLVETVVEAFVIKCPRLPSYRISGLIRRHHSTVFEDKCEAQNVFFDVAQSQSGRDSAELARDGSHYLAEELIEFGHRGEHVKP